MSRTSLGLLCFGLSQLRLEMVVELVEQVVARNLGVEVVHPVVWACCPMSASDCSSNFMVCKHPKSVAALYMTLAEGAHMVTDNTCSRLHLCQTVGILPGNNLPRQVYCVHWGKTTILIERPHKNSFSHGP